MGTNTLSRDTWRCGVKKAVRRTSRIFPVEIDAVTRQPKGNNGSINEQSSGYTTVSMKSRDLGVIDLPKYRVYNRVLLFVADCDVIR
ncbi:hypothetical protein EVAR_83698_1 [Eumeta japonica]|uniref:Uncharacterized protein n=1 Tax=Eumeta variegata TaxID=151549 RepID=A0A4C1XZF7_EUMVA|nr:hypothetical protein EVAR_83698_1 [Eumeta japonica]